MTSRAAPVVVGLDGSPPGDLALRWAIGHALATGVPLRLVSAYHWAVLHPWEAPFEELHAPELMFLSAKAEDVLARARDRALAAAPDLVVETAAIEGAPVTALLGESSHAGVLVLGARRPPVLVPVLLGSVAAAVTARSQCPVVVLREPADEPAAQAAVVVGIDGVEGSEGVLAFGFDYANKHRLPLKAIHCWKPRPFSAEPFSADARAAERAESWLTEALAGWPEKFPYVTVQREVVQDDPVPALVGASVEQSLLVVGAHTRHAIAGALFGSVSQAALHYAICPVAIVPSGNRTSAN